MAKHILVIENDVALIKALATTLKSEKFKVTTAKDGEEGLNKAKTEIPDLILLDIVMPKMDGVTLMRHLQDDQKTKNIPLIFLTDLSDVETISKVVYEGVFDYLIKTEWDINELVDLVKRRLEKKSETKQK